MGKASTILSMLIVMAALVTGCYSQEIPTDTIEDNQQYDKVQKNEDSSSVDEDEKGKAQGNIEVIEVENWSELPSMMVDEFDSMALQRGYSFLTGEREDEYILFISLGKQPSDGCDIIFQEVKMEGDKVVIVVEELLPDMVSDKVTYPHKVFYVKGEIDDVKDILVRNTFGETYKGF